MMCRLTENWANAVKFEQVYLEEVKAAEVDGKQKLVEESEKKLQEYNQKMMLKLSMRSILG